MLKLNNESAVEVRDARNDAMTTEAGLTHIKNAKHS
jgi:hypothetical protein